LVDGIFGLVAIGIGFRDKTL